MPPVITPIYARWCSLTSSLSYVQSCVASSSASVQSSTSPLLRWCMQEPQPHRPVHGLCVYKRLFEKRRQESLSIADPSWSEEQCRIALSRCRDCSLWALCVSRAALRVSISWPFHPSTPLQERTALWASRAFPLCWLINICSSEKLYHLFQNRGGQYGENN